MPLYGAFLPVYCMDAIALTLISLIAYCSSNLTMGVLRKLSEISESIGAGTNDFFDNLAEATRDFSCNLWEAFPDQITQNANVASSFARGFMNNACQDKTLPGTPSSSFIGGQCPGTLYEMRINLNLIGGGSQFGFVDPMLGPVTTFEAFNFVKINNNIPPLWSYKVRQVGFSDQGVPLDDTLDFFVNADLDGTAFTTAIPQGGGPNNCGDPPPTYPPTSPTPAQYTTIFNYVTEDGDTLNFNITYNPTDYNFPMNFKINDIDLQLNLGGFEFNYSPVDINLKPLKLTDGQDPPLPPPEDDSKRPLSCRRLPPADDVTYDETERTTSDPKSQDTSPDLQFVRVTLTQIPMDAKTQFGDGADNVIYAGWFEFKSDTFNFPRQPIHFGLSTFVPPEGSNGYAYTLYNGFEGFATEYVLKRE